MKNKESTKFTRKFTKMNNRKVGNELQTLIKLKNEYKDERKAERLYAYNAKFSNYLPAQIALKYLVDFDKKGRAYNVNTSKKLNGKHIFSVTTLNKTHMEDNPVLLAASENKVNHHSYLSNGKKVSGVGYLTFNKGRLDVISDESGHYRPQIQQMKPLLKTLRKITANDDMLYESHGYALKVSTRPRSKAPTTPNSHASIFIYRQDNDFKYSIVGANSAEVVQGDIMSEPVSLQGFQLHATNYKPDAQELETVHIYLTNGSWHYIIADEIGRLQTGILTIEELTQTLGFSPMNLKADPDGEYDLTTYRVQGLKLVSTKHRHNQVLENLKTYIDKSEINSDNNRVHIDYNIRSELISRLVNYQELLEPSSTPSAKAIYSVKKLTNSAKISSVKPLTKKKINKIRSKKRVFLNQENNSHFFCTISSERRAENANKIHDKNQPEANEGYILPQGNM